MNDLINLTPILNSVIFLFIKFSFLIYSDFIFLKNIKKYAIY